MWNSNFVCIMWQSNRKWINNTASASGRGWWQIYVSLLIGHISKKLTVPLESKSPPVVINVSSNLVIIFWKMKINNEHWLHCHAIKGQNGVQFKSMIHLHCVLIFTILENVWSVVVYHCFVAILLAHKTVKSMVATKITQLLPF